MKRVKSVIGFFLLAIIFLGAANAQNYVPSRERVPGLPREFRGAWVACVYNIDWPSRKGLSASAQKTEMRRLLDVMARMNLNAIIFQVRPHADALYRSRYEPWSPWLTGRMGRDPGYDPLAYCIAQAHARGIEVHAWFNPFRALPNAGMATSSDHITRTHPRVIRRFKNYKWMDISQSFARRRALTVILDVTRRYDVDGIHLDDYFYPYPDTTKAGVAKQNFPDGKSPRQRRSYVDGFVQEMYSSVKRTKPWVRVGISPFGIWQPGVPRGVEARINAYKHLAADSRKWLKNGWVDYLSPQLYWRIEGPQSYTKLLSWWRSQGRRPVWPGIATSRISSKEDPGRPTSEILNQVALSRQIGKNWVGHIHWSAKALLNNRRGIRNGLSRQFYQEPALVPPMPWLNKQAPARPVVQATGRNGKGVQVSWRAVATAKKYAIQVRRGRQWHTVKVLPAGVQSFTVSGAPDAIAVSAVNSYGVTSTPGVVTRR